MVGPTKRASAPDAGPQTRRTRRHHAPDPRAITRGPRDRAVATTPRQSVHRPGMPCGAAFCARNSSAVRPSPGHEHPGRDGERLPSSVLGDVPREPPAPIHAADQLVHIDEIGLELDHEKGAPAGVPGQDVDHAPLTEYRERDFRGEDPVGQRGCEPGTDRFVKPRMSPADEPVEIAGSPSSAERDLDLQGARDLEERADRHAARDGRARQPKRPTGARGLALRRPPDANRA